ncbi:hypothetical protein IF2G_04728 [Cordyceps javanica]|nr:hypothetical protein IF2G_04728 [Cordyceps javanica]
MCIRVTCPLLLSLVVVACAFLSRLPDVIDRCCRPLMGSCILLLFFNRNTN